MDDELRSRIMKAAQKQRLPLLDDDTWVNLFRSWKNNGGEGPNDHPTDDQKMAIIRDYLEDPTSRLFTNFSYKKHPLNNNEGGYYNEYTNENIPNSFYGPVPSTVRAKILGVTPNEAIESYRKLIPKESILTGPSKDPFHPMYISPEEILQHHRTNYERMKKEKQETSHKQASASFSPETRSRIMKAAKEYDDVKIINEQSDDPELSSSTYYGHMNDYLDELHSKHGWDGNKFRNLHFDIARGHMFDQYGKNGWTLPDLKAAKVKYLPDYKLGYYRPVKQIRFDKDLGGVTADFADDDQIYIDRMKKLMDGLKDSEGNTYKIMESKSFSPETRSRILKSANEIKKADAWGREVVSNTAGQNGPPSKNSMTEAGHGYGEIPLAERTELITPYGDKLEEYVEETEKPIISTPFRTNQVFDPKTEVPFDINAALADSNKKLKAHLDEQMIPFSEKYKRSEGVTDEAAIDNFLRSQAFADSIADKGYKYHEKEGEPSTWKYNGEPRSYDHMYRLATKIFKELPTETQNQIRDSLKDKTKELPRFLFGFNIDPTVFNTKAIEEEVVPKKIELGSEFGKKINGDGLSENIKTEEIPKEALQQAAEKGLTANDVFNIFG